MHDIFQSINPIAVLKENILYIGKYLIKHTKFKKTTKCSANGVPA